MKDKDSFDDFLNRAREEFQQESSPVYLWNRIDKDISGKWKEFIFFDRVIRLFKTNYKPILAFASVAVILILSLSIVLRDRDGFITATEAEYLAIEIEEEVYRAQGRYERAISKMEKHILPSGTVKHSERVEAYLAKVDMLNSLIEECKILFIENPYNEKLHKTLIAAYRNKIETLEEIERTKNEEKT